MSRNFRFKKLAEWLVQLPEGCLIGMEACSTAHHWPRKLQGYGRTVKLMAPQFVKPYVKTTKNDMTDAEAICEAVSRSDMRLNNRWPTIEAVNALL